MSVADLHVPSVLAGIVLAMLAGLLMAGLLFGIRNSLPRRLADLLLNRRGFENLGRSHRTRPRDTAYERWLETAREQIPVLDCIHIEDVRTIELEPWPQEGEGVRGLYLRLADYQVTDARILGIPGGGCTHPARHVFEVVVHVLEGAGYTECDGNTDGSRIAWRKGQVFSVPINSAYRHCCEEGEDTRLLLFTSFPLVLNTTNSEAFIDDNPFQFSDRLQPVAAADPATAGKILDLGVGAVLDSQAEVLADHSVRGAGTRARYFRFAGNSMISMNLSEMPARRIKRAHRANSDAIVLMLSGTGEVVAWPDGAWHRRMQVHWQEGTLVAMPIYWYRQFLNTGDVAARNLTAGARLWVEGLGLRLQDQRENDLPAVRRIWKAALRKNRRSE